MAGSAPEPGAVGATSLERLVREATSRIRRLEPQAAYAASEAGAVIIDIRARESRERGGVIPRSLHIPRTVLEWRVAPDSPWRNPHLGGADQHVILICDHGYASILAASSLVELGFESAADVIGGFEAWRNEGLPVAACPHPPLPTDGLPGMDPPEA